MNKDAEAIDSFLAWLLQEPNLAVAAPSGECFSQLTDLDKFGVTDVHLPALDPLDSEEAVSTDPIESGSFPVHFSLFHLGETPAVQDRFHSLIKRRLRAEIERKPPLFPWESEVLEYGLEPLEQVAAGSRPIWGTQLQNMSLPVPMPQPVLMQLFEQCQAVLQSSLREGAKLVHAVEALFPGHAPALNQLAGLVLTAPARSSAVLEQKPQPGFPQHYDVATPAQQMLLSLLAARDLLDGMTLKLSTQQPKAERQWLTDAGSVVLEAEYQNDRLRIQAQLPCPGSLHFQGQTTMSTAQRSDAGYLSVELFNLLPNQTYALEVRLDETEQPVMIFAVSPTTEA